MRIPRVYYSGQIRARETISLPSETGHYLKQVLRLSVGAILRVFNGDGHDYEATIRDRQKEVMIEIGASIEKKTESALTIHLVQAVARGEKMDWIVQKAVELGVSTITPLETQRCNVKFDQARASKRLAHWQKVIISACEQSERAHIPLLAEIQPFDQWIKVPRSGSKFYCDPVSTARFKDILPIHEAWILIGPEGGFTPAEIAVARDYHFEGMSLGPRILRTETASVAAIAVLQSHWGDI